MKIQKLMIVLILFVLLIGACAPAVEQPVGEPQEEVVSEAKPVVVSVWVSDAEAVQKAAEAYEAETGRKVVVEVIAREVLQERQKTELVSGAGAYDILWLPSEWLAELAEGGYVEPLDGYMQDASLRQPDQSDWASTQSVDAYKYGGNLYGFPVSLDALFLFYRTDLIDNPPETWDEFLQVAIEQTNDERYGTTLFGKLPESISWDFINYFWGFGAELIDEDFNATVNSDEGIAALEFFTGLLNEHGVVPPGVATYEYPEVLAAFQQDQAAMVLQWNAAYADFSNPEISPLIYDKFDVTVVPGTQMPDGSILRRSVGHVWGFVMNASSTNKRDAYEFLVYLTSKDGLPFFVDYGNSINVNSIAILSDPAIVEKHPDFEYLQESFKYMDLWPTTLATSGLILSLAEEASAALAQIKTPEQAMNDANAAIQRLMEEAGYH